MMRDLWSKLIRIGIHPGLTPLEIKYIRATNGIAIITPITVLSFLPNLIQFLPATKLLLLNLLLSILQYLFILYFTKKRLYTFAKTYMLLSAAFNVVVASLLLGGDMNFHFYLLAVLAVGYFIYSSSEKKHQFYITIFLSLIFISLEIWFSFHGGFLEFPSEFLVLSRINNNIGLLILISVLLYVISMSYTQSELDLEEERKKNELLLHNILPVPIANRLKVSHDSIAEGFQSATILFADIVGFTTLAESKTPEEVIGILNEIFSEFDQLVDETNLEKIKTIGDAYMVASGLPLESPDHAKLIAWLALKMRESLSKFNQNSGQKLEIRIGIHSGPVVAGVIGKKKFTYDVWGDTVNTASRMESHGIPGKIQISEKTFSILKDDFECMERGLIEIKGKGFMKTYILMGYKG